MEEVQIATAEEVLGQEPKTPEQHLADEREKALADFKAVIATKPGKAAIKAFLRTKCTGYLTETFGGQLTRQQRREAARQVSKRLTKRVMAGEDVF